MTVDRAAHQATLLADGNVLITGGFTGDEVGLDSAEIYDAAKAAAPSCTIRRLASSAAPDRCGRPASRLKRQWPRCQQAPWWWPAATGR
jgi:hypothetical protein